MDDDNDNYDEDINFRIIDNPDPERLQQIELRQQHWIIISQNFPSTNTFVDEFNPNEYISFFDIPEIIRDILTIRLNQIDHTPEFVEYFNKHYLSPIIFSCQMNWLDYYRLNNNRDKIVETFNNPRMSREYLNTYNLTFDVRLYLVELFSENIMQTDPIIIEWFNNYDLFNYESRTEIVIVLAKNNLFDRFVEQIDEVVEQIDEIINEEYQHVMIDFITFITDSIKYNISREYHEYVANAFNYNYIKFFVEKLYDHIQSSIDFIRFSVEQISDLDNERECYITIRDNILSALENSHHMNNNEIQRKIVDTQNKLAELDEIIEIRRQYLEGI